MHELLALKLLLFSHVNILVAKQTRRTAIVSAEVTTVARTSQVPIKQTSRAPKEQTLKPSRSSSVISPALSIDAQEAIGCNGISTSFVGISHVSSEFLASILSLSLFSSSGAIGSSS